jgi:hypothetical protein
MRSSSRFLPGWLRGYRRQTLLADLSAGLIVTVLVIPQSLAYALLAGLPPQVGLYVSIFPVIAYALLGSSRVQAVGPVAVTAIMTYAVLTPLAAAGSPRYLMLAAALALISGVDAVRLRGAAPRFPRAVVEPAGDQRFHFRFGDPDRRQPDEAFLRLRRPAPAIPGRWRVIC